ncbi:MAG: mannose-1-phosphate guanylyltransferase/mannose-6-phosphate isomerase, partial [Gammaproteobacteria bacterium]|nr:mannose-1-phosphate guanylyltransferase/mannose-6-phosphate isomerase [Gammaproteobacteria bacterium]
MIIPVILSGGLGTRLWPLSREVLPKQFLSLTGDVTLFESTVERVRGIPDCDDPLVICNEEHRFLVAEQLRKRDYKASGIILEPVGRNTAPAVACAALYALEWHDDAML